jgi:hypothetical protein
MHDRLLAVLLALAPLACAAPTSVSTPVTLFDGATLQGWHALGDARYTVDDGCILGEVGGGGQSFLVSDGRYGDFLLELDVRNELPGNSGVQVRSQVRENGRLFGYQIEIDPSERAWSGGLYDEARRGWLDDLADDPAARAAFRPGEWNRYRIECRGTWIRAWVNDVPTADALDAMDLEGHIALQVHSGDDTRVRWRIVELIDHGVRRWQAVPVTAPWTWVAIQGDGGAARYVVRPDSARPDALELKVDFDGQVRTFQRGARERTAGSPVTVDVLRQGRRWAVQVDGATLWSGTTDGERAAVSEVALSVGEGHMLLSAATLGPPAR